MTSATPRSFSAWPQPLVCPLVPKTAKKPWLHALTNTFARAAPEEVGHGHLLQLGH